LRSNTRRYALRNFVSSALKQIKDAIRFPPNLQNFQNESAVFRFLNLWEINYPNHTTVSSKHAIFGNETHGTVAVSLKKR